jgi:hypothetical protein
MFQSTELLQQRAPIVSKNHLHSDSHNSTKAKTRAKPQKRDFFTIVGNNNSSYKKEKNTSWRKHTYDSSNEQASISNQIPQMQSGVLNHRLFCSFVIHIVATQTSQEALQTNPS